MTAHSRMRCGCALALALGFGLIGCKGKKKHEPAPVAVELYVMSQCPYGVQAEDSIVPALEKLGDNVDLKVEFIGTTGPDGKLSSMHGQNEVDGNIAQLCAAKVSPKSFRKFLLCTNKEWKTIPNNVDQCAKDNAVDVKALTACRTGEEGKKLLAESYKRSEAAKAEGSPTIKINGKAYEGGRRPNDILSAACEAFGDKKKPQACSTIPKPPEVKVTVLTDKRCKKCETDQIVSRLKQVFPGLAATVLDWSDPQAKTTAADAQVKLLPAILFDESVDKDQEGMQQVGRWLVPAGKFKSLRVPAEFDPTAEICDNTSDDNADGKADCDDPTCKENLACRPEKKGQLDVFVMSQCPYGVMGLNAMKDVLDAFGKEMTFNVHFIASARGDAIQSMHGQAEVDEDIRELCAIKHYGQNNKYMDYVLCRNKSIQSSEWKTCATNGIDAKVMEKCFTGPEGKALLAADLKVAEGLQIGASPTWLVNNRTTFSGVSPADIQKNFCQHNPGLKGCTKTFAAPASPAPAGNCGH